MVRKYTVSGNYLLTLCLSYKACESSEVDPLGSAWELFRIVYDSEHIYDKSKAGRMKDRFGHLLDTKMKDFIFGDWYASMKDTLAFFKDSEVVYIIDTISRLPFDE